MENIPAGIICTQEQYERSTIDPSIHCLTRGETIGLMIVSESGFISFFAVIYVFWIIAHNIVYRARKASGASCQLFEKPVDILLLSLFCAELIHALGAVLDIKWVNDGIVETGSYCTAQGVIQQFGETGVAISTLSIAMYTFVGIWWRLGTPQIQRKAIFVIKMVMGVVWLFIILIVVVGNTVHLKKDKLYESPTPYWCWIGQGYLELRIWGEYFWIWLTLLFSIASYLLLYFWSRGNITRTDEDPWWKFEIHKTKSPSDVRERRQQSLTMLVYPLMYCILVLPVSVVRWRGFVEEQDGKSNNIPSTATLAVAAIYWLSGACNAILLLATRPISILFHGRSANSSAGRELSPGLDGYRGDGGSEEEVDGLALGRLPSQ